MTQETLKVPRITTYELLGDANLQRPQNQVHKKMTKDANYERSSQQSKENLKYRRNGQGPEHLKFFLLVFLNIQKNVVNKLGSHEGSK